MKNIKCQGERTVYNLEIEGPNDYFANGFLVHNCSSFKSCSAKRFRRLKPILPLCRVAVILSGTPAPNGLLDLWSQIFIVDCGEALGRTFTGFKHLFFDSDYWGYTWTPKARAREEIEKALAPLCLSMSAADYLTMPDRMDVTRTAYLSAAEARAYKDFKRTMLAEVAGVEITAVNAAVLAGKLQQWANGAIYREDGSWVETHTAKLDVLTEIIEDNPNENIIVAYNYKHDLARLLARFPDAVEFRGRPDQIMAWNSGAVRLMLAQPASCGHGLNLQAGGSIIVWFGLTWNLELYQQMNARLHRQGQTRPVRVVHIVSDDTIDADVMDALGGKASVQDALLSALNREFPHQNRGEIPLA